MPTYRLRNGQNIPCWAALELNLIQSMSMLSELGTEDKIGLVVDKYLEGAKIIWPLCYGKASFLSKPTACNKAGSEMVFSNACCFMTYVDAS